jgi:hypothetical protein
MSQLEQFKTVVNGESVWLSGSPMFVMLGLVALTIAIVVFLPSDQSCTGFISSHYCGFLIFRVRN